MEWGTRTVRQPFGVRARSAALDDSCHGWLAQPWSSPTQHCRASRQWHPHPPLKRHQGLVRSSRLPHPSRGFQPPREVKLRQLGSAHWAPRRRLRLPSRGVGNLREGMRPAPHSERLSPVMPVRAWPKHRPSAVRCEEPLCTPHRAAGRAGLLRIAITGGRTPRVTAERSSCKRAACSHVRELVGDVPQQKLRREQSRGGAKKIGARNRERQGGALSPFRPRHDHLTFPYSSAPRPDHDLRGHAAVRRGVWGTRPRFGFPTRPDTLGHCRSTASLIETVAGKLALLFAVVSPPRD
jgi:hypothetical protein